MILIMLVYLKERVLIKMIISIIYLAIALFLEMLMSNFFISTLGSSSLFITVYTIISFVIIYPYFNNDKKYFILVLVFGILFDILYTSTYFFVPLLFIILGMGIKFLYNIFPENIFMTNLISLIIITLYHILSFVILNIFSTISFSFITLFNAILGSIIMTIIYTSISYYVMSFIYDRKKVKLIK